MANIRVKDLDTKSSFASDDEILMDSPSGTGTMLRDAFISAVAAQIVAAPSTYKIATLDGADKLTSSQDPSQSVSYLGGHDMVANSPALADGSGTAGDTYYVTNPGTRDYGSGNITAAEGDALVYSGTVWQLVEGIANILDGISTAVTARTTLEVNSVDEVAEGIGTKLVGPALYFDGSNDYIEVADDDKLSFTDGTDDLPFTVSAWINMTATGRHPILAKWGTSAANREWLFGVGASNQLRLDLTNVAGNSPYRLQDASLSGYVGQWIHVAVTYGGAGPNSASAFTAAADEITFYVNGEAVASTATNNGSYDGMADTAQAVWSGRESNNYGQHHIRNVQIYNRELTATEVAQLARGNDLGFSEEWGGANGGVYTSDFSAGVDSWTATRGTADGNVDAIGGQDDNLRLTIDTSNNSHFLKSGSILNAGTRYRLTADFYIPSTNSHLDGITFYCGTSNPTTISTQSAPTLDSWNSISSEFVASATVGADSIVVNVSDGGSLTVNDAGGDDVFYIRNIKITQIGTLADFRAENYDSATGKIYDISDNAFVGTSVNLPTLTGRAYPVYETGTWTPTLTLGGGNTGMTYSVQDGNYTRIGNICHLNGIITLSAKGSSTGQVDLNGFPFAAANTASSQQTFVIGYASSVTGLTSAISGLIDDAGTEAQLYDWGATGATNIDDTNLTDTSNLRFSLTYQIQ